MTADWSLDAAAVTSSSDLFGGDLFGDELMDMYNSAAVVGSGSTDVIESISEIPHLLPASNDEPSNHHNAHVKSEAPVASINTTPDHAPGADHPGAQVAMAAAAMDDGLGAFRPSTSFSDFGSLLPAEGEQAATAQAQPAGAAAATSTVVPAGAINATAGPSPASKVEAAKPKKRGRSVPKETGAAAAATAAAAPAPKKRKAAPAARATRATKATPAAAAPVAATVHPVSPTAAKVPTVPAKKTVKQAAAGDNGANKNTPNPLALPSMSGKARAPTVVTPKPTAAATTAAAAVLPAKTAVAAPTVPTAAGAPTRQVVVPPRGAVATAAAAAAAAAKAAANRPTTATATATASSMSAAGMTPAASSLAAAKAAAVAKSAATTVPTAAAPAPVTSSSVVTAAPQPASRKGEEVTEDDFKGVAQAAVNNLIISVGAKATQNAAGAKTGAAGAASAAAAAAAASDSGASNNGKAVDTSSAHIAALTSSNWVAACSESIGDAPPGSQQAAQAAALAAAAAASDPAVSKAARARRANLTPDERARQNRDRNREHARNTRLRKKAYVEELKKTLTELVAQRDASELERRHEAQRDLEVREVRFRVMEEFLKLRGQGGNPGLLSRWVAIMEEGFTLKLPRTEYRTMVHQGQQPRGMTRAVSIDHNAASAPAASAIAANEQVLKGASEVVADASNLAAFVNGFGNGANVVGSGQVVRFAHHCDRKKFMMDGVNAVLEWTASTSGAVAKGAPAELVMKGTMRATFSPASNKLVCAELLFDTGSIASQAKNLVPPPAVETDVAAQVAASEADALLDSIQMPQLATPAPAVVMSTVLSATSLDGAAGNAGASESSNVSVTSSEKGESSSDESVDGTAATNGKIVKEESVATRRSTRAQ